MKQYGKNAKLLRVQSGLTQKELANELHININTIVRFESGKLPNTETIVAYSDFFKTSTDRILDRKPIFFN